MYSNYPYMHHPNRFVNYPYWQYPYAGIYNNNSMLPDVTERQQAVRGQATWTEGGQVTQCGIPWSDNQYMTAAVGTNSPYQCGQTLKIRNLSIPGQREVLVTVVDKVPGYPANKINLHRRAFEALGTNPNVGIINVTITPSPELEEEKWGKYLLEIAQTAYPDYNVTEYEKIGENQIDQTQTREVYEYLLTSSQGDIRVRGTVIYDTQTDRVISFDLREV
ncbi:DUF3889 domain-containing protein [Virgibacillus profundi]|nr:DUF3889 domain-containing protein [Virgibacillus profundi]